MNNLKTWAVSGVIVLSVMGGLAWFGLTPFKPANGVDGINGLAGSSATGSTFNTAKVAAITFAPAAAGATTTGILNTDANDRIVQDSFATCNTLGTSFTAYTGAALANLIFTAATGTTQAPNANTNTNLALNVTIATTTANVQYTASTTFTNIQARVWAAGTYMNFASNATNTAVCNVGVHYLAS